LDRRHSSNDRLAPGTFRSGRIQRGQFGERAHHRVEPGEVSGAGAGVSGAGDREGPTDSGRAVVLRKESSMKLTAPFCRILPVAKRAAPGLVRVLLPRLRMPRGRGLRLRLASRMRRWWAPGWRGLRASEVGRIPLSSWTMAQSPFSRTPRRLPAALFGQRCLGFNLYVYSHMV
jgi:hypothetical protein